MGRVSREGQARAKRACLEGYIRGVNRAAVAGEWGIPSGADRDVRRIVRNRKGKVGRSVLRGACRKGIKSVSVSFILTGSTGPVASKMGAVERVEKGKMGRGARGPPRVS